MPCEPLCPMIRRNLIVQLLLVKEKIATLRQMLCVEFDVQPMTTPEEKCSQQQVLDLKLAEADARLAKIADNIATGCVACRTIQ